MHVRHLRIVLSAETSQFTLLLPRSDLRRHTCRVKRQCSACPQAYRVQASAVVNAG
jgi:hypothetical protein